MEAQTKPRLTVAEYLAFEAESEIKHEYIDGEIFAMTGGTDNHSRIAANVIIAVGAQLIGSACYVHTSEMRIKAASSRYVYPDLSVVCGQARHEDDGKTSLLNPILVVEVTSPTSMIYDHGLKREMYQQVASIEAYLIIDQRSIRAELHTRVGSDWRLQTFTGREDIIPLPMLDCDLPIAQVYRGIVFSA